MYYVVQGGNQLQGELAVYGAKNCALALLGATVLTEDAVTLTNCPPIVDVQNMLQLLATLGKKVTQDGYTVTVSGGLNCCVAPQNIASLLRGSVLVLGGMLAMYGNAKLPLPGGCAIGARPIDIHLDGLQSMGVQICYQNDSVFCDGYPKPTTYNLSFASVGATENLLCASVLCKGKTTLCNCATEPEVVALQQLLTQMGAKIEGIGTPKLTITGVKQLHGATFKVIPDRIVTATYLSACLATGGNLTVTNCNPKHLTAFLRLLGGKCTLKLYDDAISMRGNGKFGGFGRIVTAPYPRFATDMQSLVLSLSAMAKGKTTIVENLFENRLVHNACQLAQMGANVAVKGNKAVIRGQKLRGAKVQANDLRGGAGLVIASLGADGQSVIEGVQHVNRGYLNLHTALQQLGANIVLQN